MKVALKYSLTIFVFALLHAGCCVACRSMGVEDSHALTLITVAMTVILCFQREMKLLHMVAAAILVLVLAYLVGNFLPKILYPLMGEGMWVHALSTFVTTLLLGFVFELCVSFFLKKSSLASAPVYRQRWVVHIGDRIVPVKTDQIAYFFSENKSNFLVTFEGEKYIIDSTMDAVSENLDPSRFFRINRGCILSLPSIDSAVKSAGRLTVEVHPASELAMTVTRSRVDEFIAWLGQV